jgi:hypothetical protein
MNVAVVVARPPFATNRPTQIARALTRELSDHGFGAQLVELPFRADGMETITDAMLASALVEVDVADRVVAVNFPGYYAQHDSKVLWLLERHRPVYELWSDDSAADDTAGGGPVPDVRSASAIRHAVIRADNACFSTSHALYVASEEAYDAVRHYNGCAAGVLHPPPTVTVEGATGAGDYVLMSALAGAGTDARVDLVLDAIGRVRSAVRLVVTAPTARARDDAAGLVRERGLEDRVEIVSSTDQREAAALVAGALALVIVPRQGDDVSSVLDAFGARTAVVTATDAGAPQRFVDDAGGCVVEPDAGALADAFDTLFADRAATARIGEAGFERLRALDLSWTKVVEALTA